MDIATLVAVLDVPQRATEVLSGWGVRDAEAGRLRLLELAESGLTLDLLSEVCGQLAECLPNALHADETFDAFTRYCRSVRSPLALAALLVRDRAAMRTLLASLSLGQPAAAALIDDPEALDLLREAEGRSVPSAALAAELINELASLHEDRSIAAALWRLKQRHLLRIAYGEFVSKQPLEWVFQELTSLAEAITEGTLFAARRKTFENRSSAGRSATRAGDCVIAVGPVGAMQCDYGLALSLLIVFEEPLADSAASRALREQYERFAKHLLRYLQEGGMGEPRLLSLPDSQSPSLTHALDDVVVGFDSFGRTWHRQEMLKARPVAGDRSLGNTAIARLQPWLYRRYLNRADETGIRALKHRLLVQANMRQDDWRNVHTGRGGLCDIEATVEFLQLLAGGDQPTIRRPATLAALHALVEAGSITPDEFVRLRDGYAWLRQLEHALQVHIGPQSIEIPADQVIVDRLAKLIHEASGDALTAKLRQTLDDAWTAIRRLLDSAFAEDPVAPREVDLLLDPAPQPEEIRVALAPFGFQQPAAALATLNDLATEHVPFLSTRRCRHQLSVILPRLLTSVAATPSPDRTLANLQRVSASLGGKGILWDLFRRDRPTLDLYVRLCAASPYLSDLLTTSPGMIDELIDSLQLDKLPTASELAATLAELCRGATDTLPVLHDFKNAQHLRIGVRDILGREDIDRTHHALADVAEACLTHVAKREYFRLVEKYGLPTTRLGGSEGEPSRPVIVALGKLGGREPNYHSQLDVLFLYEAEGTTRPTSRGRRQESTANNHFYTQLAQRIMKAMSELTAKGRLYSVAPLLRPIGVSGALALSLADFERHFSAGAAPLWQWQALCQARPVFGEAALVEHTGALVRRLLSERQPQSDELAQLRRHRLQYEEGAATSNLKRAAGGTLDVEFLVQGLQVRYAGQHPSVLHTHTPTALAALAEARLIPPHLAGELVDSYRFLRRVESALRLLNTAKRHDLPDEGQVLGQLALLLGHSNPARLRQQCFDAMAKNRAAFDELVPETTDAA